MLIDSFGRKITDLRISITNRCNFNCLYCHNEGQGAVQSIAVRENELTVSEIVQVVRIAKEFNITQVKLSGGEPLIRKDCEEIISALAPMVKVSMVTNGSLLANRAAALKKAGLSRINVSLDSLDPAIFSVVRRGHIRPVLEGILKALEAGIRPVKLNMVVFKNTIDSIEGILGFVREHEGLKLQLIQYMPEIAGHAERGIDIQEVKRYLTGEADRIDIRKMHHRRIYYLSGAKVEVVDPVENKEFCGNCKRLRITANGCLKGCLNRPDDLVSIRNLDDEGLRNVFRQVTKERMPYYYNYLNSPSVTGARLRRPSAFGQSKEVAAYR